MQLQGEIAPAQHQHPPPLASHALVCWGEWHNPTPTPCPPAPIAPANPSASPRWASCIPPSQTHKPRSIGAPLPPPKSPCSPSLGGTGLFHSLLSTPVQPSHCGADHIPYLAPDRLCAHPPTLPPSPQPSRGAFVRGAGVGGISPAQEHPTPCPAFIRAQRERTPAPTPPGSALLLGGKGGAMSPAQPSPSPSSAPGLWGWGACSSWLGSHASWACFAGQRGVSTSTRAAPTGPAAGKEHPAQPGRQHHTASCARWGVGHIVCIHVHGCTRATRQLWLVAGRHAGIKGRAAVWRLVAGL